jgi:glycerol dehydrogenase
MNAKNEVLKAVFPGKYIQAAGLIAELPNYIKSFGNSGLIICSPTAKDKILSNHISNFKKDDIIIEQFNGECSEREIKRLYDIVIENNIDVVVAVGGGKSIDTAKIVADRANCSVIIAPTIASTDAPCSGCAVIYTDSGVFESVYYQKLNPQIVLMDIEVIANAPVRFLISGMGDALATWFEARSCLRTRSLNECGGLSTLAALNIAKLCYDTILNYGSQAIQANKNNVITPALHHIVEANTLLSGIGFESSGLASAHSIHNGFSAIEETHNYYHGEKVAFGVLAGLHLTDAQPEEIDRVYGFCEEIGLPTTLEQIGMIEPDKSQLMLVAEKACQPEEGIHNEAGEITPEKVMSAIIVADAMGRRRKSQIKI